MLQVRNDTMEWRSPVWRGGFGRSPELAALESGRIGAAITTRLDPVKTRLEQMLNSMACISIVKADEAVQLDGFVTPLAFGLQAAGKLADKGGEDALACTPWAVDTLTMDGLSRLVRAASGVSVIQLTRGGGRHSFLLPGDPAEAGRGVRMFTVSVDMDGYHIAVADPWDMRLPLPVRLRLFGSPEFVRRAKRAQERGSGAAARRARRTVTVSVG